MIIFSEGNYGKMQEPARQLTAIRGRCGCDALMRAAFLGSSIGHMSGGISDTAGLGWEKREVDYGKVTDL